MQTAVTCTVYDNNGVITIHILISILVVISDNFSVSGKYVFSFHVARLVCFGLNAFIDQSNMTSYSPNALQT